MNVIAKILTGVGLLITVFSNLATYLGVRTAVNGIRNSAEGGIGAIASGMSSASFYSFVSLIGCLLLIIGLALTAFGGKRQP
jgi:hypothetical protein